ncbi:disulfide bond formation protein B [Pelagibacteraceae bacterium]|jgi:disulfide bond formation protein DsbB|nr:disulfide bond formation protein B [Pelagibacteraceae bacterium]MDC0339487.1 disulfide bond formation protein B [Pelagibacteraceae bacterium]MDC0366145.1 disulfide bond formation protein B [Pelagibacteraceae bacterium]|tara:strand:- start:530 stop:1009 length:480 start_codon:yes stop_codon:yes gene_type:complete
MSSIKNKFTLSTVLIFSIFALITAYFIQYILGHEPCNLCLIERIPYFTAVALISLVFFLNKYEKLISLIVGLFFIFGAIISFYHFGIEQGFFKESLVCDLGDNKAASAKDLLKQLEKEIISCKDVSFKILGLSLATFNTIISTIISVIMLKIVIIYDKN